MYKKLRGAYFPTIVGQGAPSFGTHFTRKLLHLHHSTRQIVKPGQTHLCLCSPGHLEQYRNRVREESQAGIYSGGGGGGGGSGAIVLKFVYNEPFLK